MTRRLAVPESLDRGAGRLGNQLWQIASTIGVALDRGYDPAIPDDWTYRDVFSIPDDWYVDRARMGSLDNVQNSGAVQYIKDPWRQYLQDYALWRDHAGTVRDVFELRPEVSTAVDVMAAANLTWRYPEDAELPTICFHVRRGDNVTNEPGTINCLPRSYYDEARCLAEGNGWEPHGSCTFFTDDPQYVDDVFVADGDYAPARVYWDGVVRPKEQMATYFTEEVYDWIDLAMMCRPRWDAFVMSNSTYAWWAAFLSRCERVFYPSYWVGPQLTGAGFRPEALFDGLPWQMIDTGSVLDEPR